jgi:5-methyltetrahydropteroyltriglutamate--homocysteine methyltransferase
VWAAVNHALRGIPADKVRFHTCYSINMGPRTHDMALKDIIDLLFTINAEGISYEAGNPRHDHEWQVFKDVKLPSDKVLIPGVISHTTTLVEHPEFIAQRLTQYADVVGRENVIAGSDCGFSSQATHEPEIHPTVVVAKLKAMAEGAALASRHLWG